MIQHPHNMQRTTLDGFLASPHEGRGDVQGALHSRRDMLRRFAALGLIAASGTALTPLAAEAASASITAANLTIENVGTDSYGAVTIKAVAQLSSVAQNEIRAGTADYWFVVRLWEEDDDWN